MRTASAVWATTMPRAHARRQSNSKCTRRTPCSLLRPAACLFNGVSRTTSQPHCSPVLRATQKAGRVLFDALALLAECNHAQVCCCCLVFTDQATPLAGVIPTACVASTQG
ncbi:unnamed protein product [Toxocara canis]|uniref:Secreted protein n=1 Tax=Toxocara canis TaxID=6265 RepID=A0A183UHY7_TOXCA|nr:unnamed protein product [Toxocara canis]